MAQNIGTVYQHPTNTNKAVTVAASYLNFSSSQLVKGTPGDLLGVFTTSSASGTLQLFDNTTSGGTQLASTFNVVAGTFYQIPVFFGTGLYITIGGTLNCTVAYN